MTDVVRAPDTTNYLLSSNMEWVETDGVGGMASSSILGANTRKQHALLAMEVEDGRRISLVANLQETLTIGNHTFELSTNAYFGAIHPVGYLSLESFTHHPWPTWRFRLGSAILQKELIMVHGEHTIIVQYTLLDTEEQGQLTVRPLLAFRDINQLRAERDSAPKNWLATSEFIEVKPFDHAPALFIAHPGVHIETIGFWYRGFLYERDRENHLDCAEDLYHPGYFEIPLKPTKATHLIFSTPSPRPVTLAPEYIENERTRRHAVGHITGHPDDSFFKQLLAAGDKFIYERPDGNTGIFAGLPWEECEVFHALLAFPGLLLAPRRFEETKGFLAGIDKDWRAAGSPSKFCPEGIPGQMHPADTPLWIFISAWRYYRAVGHDDFVDDLLLPLLQEIAEYYVDSEEVHLTQEGLLAVGYEPGANYTPIIPLGTNVLWYNAQMILSHFLQMRHAQTAWSWRVQAQRSMESLQDLFACRCRPGLADSVTVDSHWRDESLRVSQVLTIGLPFTVIGNAEPIITMLNDDLLTPLGLRTLSCKDSRYTGNGSDVSRLPKYWSGSVDPTWTGYYWDAIYTARKTPCPPNAFSHFERELQRRGLGQISGAFAGTFPHEPCDYIAAASVIGELTRIYARDILHYKHLA